MINNNYTSKNIKSLDGIEHVRLRPSMYIGDVNINGLHHLAYEVINNSIDETLSGFCNKIIISINENNSITVFDNGRGIPVDYHKDEKKSALEVVMTKIGSGGKFDKNSYKFSGGLHGVGISCVNALSKKLIAKIYRDGYLYKQEYFRGKPKYDVKIIKKTNKTGTYIKFYPDKKIFNNIKYDYKILYNYIEELSYLNPKIFLKLIDKRKNNIKSKIFLSNKGLKDFLLLKVKKHNILISNIFNINENINDKIINIVMCYNNSNKEKIYSYVNNIKTYEGGTHVTGFRRSITRTIKKYIEKYNKYNKNKINFIGEDIREGLSAIISLKILNPQFEGQTKSKLVNNDISGIIDKITGKKLYIYLEENPNDAKKIIEKIFLSAKIRQNSKRSRDLINKKLHFNNFNFPLKLSDCTSNNPEISEIYLVEGDSAGGTAKQGRDRKFQAILPLRGKILNVEKSIKYKVLENEEIRNIFISLGVYLKNKGKNQELYIKKLRYHKIIIMTDADVDGSHISTLILTFFFRYMKKLIEKKYIYIATPPLFCIKNNKNIQYAWNEKEKENIIKNIINKNKIIIQRYKGLGEMNSHQLWETTMNPKNRILRNINIYNIQKTEKTFSTLMGDDVIIRKKFIQKNYNLAKIDI